MAYHLQEPDDFAGSEFSEEWTHREDDAGEEITKVANGYTDPAELKEQFECGLFDHIVLEHDADFHHMEQYISDTVGARIEKLNALELV